MPKRRKLDTLLLAAALFAISGAVLAYNIYTSDGGSITVSLSELIEYDDTVSASLVHNAAAENLLNGSVYTNATPSDVPVGALLPPIVTPPTE